MWKLTFFMLLLLLLRKMTEQIGNKSFAENYRKNICFTLAFFDLVLLLHSLLKFSCSIILHQLLEYGLCAVMSIVDLLQFLPHILTNNKSTSCVVNQFCGIVQIVWEFSILDCYGYENV